MSDKEQTKSPNLEHKEFSKKIADYILLDQIGQGTFSKVARAFHTISEQIVAVKILDKKKIEDEVDIERINREIEILRNIYHPNVCQMYETYTTIHNYYLIMEYVPGGDLFDYISEKSFLPENQACYFFRQLISAMEYLSSLGVTHRDIKPENILLNEDYTQIKLIDFGLSNYAENGEFLQSSCGSPCYASPEMLSGKPYSGLETDIWSAGIVLYSMLVGGLPFDDVELKSLYKQIKEGKFYIPSTLSLEAIDLLKQILRVDPRKRITFRELKEHKWFNLEKNVMYKGVNIYYEKMPCDIKVIKYIINVYFSEDNISLFDFAKMVKNFACNKYTATYYLVKKYILKKDDININGQNHYKNNKISNGKDIYKTVYKETKETKEEINNIKKNSNNINYNNTYNKKVINKRNKRNSSDNFCNYVGNSTPSNQIINYLNLTTKEDRTNKKSNIGNINNNTILSENKEKIKIKKLEIKNNMVLTKPIIKNNNIILKKDLTIKNVENTEFKNDNSSLKLGLSLINVNKHKITESLTERNNFEKYKNSNYDKIYSYINTNSNSNSINKLKSASKKNKKIKSYLDKIISPRKGDLNFYVINNIINKEKQVKKKRIKNELFNLEVNSNFNKNNYTSTSNHDNIIVNINNNNYINNSLNKNNLQNLNNITSPTKKAKNKNIISQIKVNLKSSKKEIKNKISPKKTEKNSPRTRNNYHFMEIYKKAISPIRELNIINSNKISKYINFNTNISNSRKKRKNFIINNNTNKANNSIYKNVNIINKEKLKQIDNNHRKIKSVYNQNNSLFDYFYYNENKKNYVHKMNTSTNTKSQNNDSKNYTNSNIYDNVNNINKNLNYSEEKIMTKKIINKPRIKIQKNKITNFNLQNNKNKELNSFIVDKLKKNKIIIYNDNNQI